MSERERDRESVRVSKQHMCVCVCVCVGSRGRWGIILAWRTTVGLKDVEGAGDIVDCHLPAPGFINVLAAILHEALLDQLPFEQ
jgi:hypothetical protein